MSRAIFVSSCGDPFLTLLTHRLFRERWYEEADRFYININNHAEVPSGVIGELLQKLSQDPKVHILYHPVGIGNGMPVTEMTLVSREDVIMLLEDDGFIFTSGHVNSCFEQIEKGHYDALGSPRNSCGQEIVDAAIKKYNIDISGYGDKGVTFWPNFFFTKREYLLKTDLNFASKEFAKGVYYKEIDHTMTETQYGDTFVWASLQLRYQGLRFKDIPQFHASPNEIEDHRSRVGNWLNTDPYWIHAGSLSSGWGGYLSGKVPDVSTDIAKQEIESRVAFWIIAQDNAEGFREFKGVYLKGIDQLITNAHLDMDRIGKKVQIYETLLKI